MGNDSAFKQNISNRTPFKQLKGQVARWLEQLAEFDYEIKHRSHTWCRKNAVSEPLTVFFQTR